MAETQGIQLDVRTPDNKIMVQVTSRPIGTYTCFASEGDNTSYAHYVGGGQMISNYHHIGDPVNQVIYVDYNVMENKTFMREGYSVWMGADFDALNLEVVPTVTAYTAGTGTYFNLYQGYFILPAAGDGNINVQPQDIRLVEIPFSLDNPTVRQSPAFWNADYSTQTHQFSNITPAPNGDGVYNMFGAEIVFQRPVNLRLIGDHTMKLENSDIAQIAHGLRLRFTFDTVGVDHEWKITVTLAMHREHVSTF